MTLKKPEPEQPKTREQELSDFMRQFDFSHLWTDEEPQGIFSKFVPWINLFLALIIMMILIFK